VGGVVRYYRNTSLLFSSPMSPKYPLIVDTALHSPGATLARVVISRNWSSPFNQPVAWKSAGGVTVSAHKLTKFAPIGWGNAGAISTKSLPGGDGFVEHTVQETNTYRLIGLSHGNTDNERDDIDFALYTRADGTLRILEKGIPRGSLGAYACGDTLRVAVVGGFVRYYRNGKLLYTSTMAPVYPLIVDAALHTPGATLSTVMISRTFD
jgi:hypothetical protein